MDEILNNFLWAGDKFMPEMYLRQSILTCSAFGPFAENKEKLQKFKERGDSGYIY